MGRHSWPSYYIPSCQSVNFKGFPAYSAGLCGECGFIFCQGERINPSSGLEAVALPH